MGTPSSILERFNVVQSGLPNAPTLLLLHGLGCDQTLWHPVLLGRRLFKIAALNDPTK